LILAVVIDCDGRSVWWKCRSDKLVRELVLDDPAPFVPLPMSKRGKQVDYEAKR